jgi:hypothetical protein
MHIKAMLPKTWYVYTTITIILKKEKNKVERRGLNLALDVSRLLDDRISN